MTTEPNAPDQSCPDCGCQCIFGVCVRCSEATSRPMERVKPKSEYL